MSLKVIIADTNRVPTKRASMSKTKNKSARHIVAAVDGSRQFVLHPESNDLFMRTGHQVIAACRLSISVEVWLEECVALFSYVNDWACKHKDMIAACYAIPRGDGIGLFFVPKSQSFNFDLADDLAELNRDLAQTFNVGSIEIHQVPQGELCRFVTREESRQVYSDADSPRQAVEA